MRIVQAPEIPSANARVTSYGDNDLIGLVAPDERATDANDVMIRCLAQKRYVVPKRKRGQERLVPRHPASEKPSNIFDTHRHDSN